MGFVVWCMKARQMLLCHIYTQAGFASIHECPYSLCNPPTLSLSRHWTACGNVETFLRLTAAASYPTMALLVENDSCCTSIGLRAATGFKQAAREGRSMGCSQFHSAPPLRPDQLGQEESQLSSHHPGGLLLHAASPNSSLNVSEERFHFEPVSISASLTSTFRPPRLLFLKVGRMWVF